jgi:hypothetical protein
LNDRGLPLTRTKIVNRPATQCRYHARKDKIYALSVTIHNVA